MLEPFVKIKNIGSKLTVSEWKTLTKVTLKSVVETKFVLILYIQNTKPGSTKHSQKYQKTPCSGTFQEGPKFLGMLKPTNLSMPKPTRK